MYTEGRGKLYYYFGLGDDNDAVILCNVLFIPKLVQSLLSVRRVDELRRHVLFNKWRISIHHEWRLHGDSYSCHTLYHMHIIYQHDLNTALDKDSKKIWHKQFGHVHMNSLDSMLSEDKVYDVSSVNKFLCKGCIKGKLHKTPFRNNESHAFYKLELLQSDVCDKMGQLVTITTSLQLEQLVTITSSLHLLMTNLN